MVKVLVGQYVAMGEFSGHWAKFGGVKISSYEREDIVYTLYKCTAYSYDAYRVHTSNEHDPLAPVYELHPYKSTGAAHPLKRDYSEPYSKEDLANAYPLFLKDLDFLDTRRIDPRPRNR